MLSLVLFNTELAGTIRQEKEIKSCKVRNKNFFLNDCVKTSDGIYKKSVSLASKFSKVTEYKNERQESNTC